MENLRFIGLILLSSIGCATAPKLTPAQVQACEVEAFSKGEHDRWQNPSFDLATNRAVGVHGTGVQAQALYTCLGD
jgi:hypothetical protein